VSANWDCVIDSDTGLMWEKKTEDQGLRDAAWTYMNTTNITNEDPRTNYDWGTCAASEVDTDGIFCHTEGYVDSVNASGLCGYSNWRLPMIEELETLFVDNINSPYIETTYFQNTRNWYYWSSTRFNTRASWYAQFFTAFGWTWALNHQNSSSVRLVRNAQ